jgi:hypothetical protein
LQYEQEFNRLSRYAATLVSNEATKTRRFVEGLIPSTRRLIAIYNLESFRAAVDMALVCESEDARAKIENNYDNPVGKGLFRDKQNVERLVAPTVALAQQHQELDISPGQPKFRKKCYKCGEKHKASQCQKNDRVCFQCQETGHLAANCPTLMSSQMVRTIDLAPQEPSYSLKRRADGICYNCRNLGHFIKDCPEPPSTRTLQEQKKKRMKT